jgi:HD-like signal output (HDOD) protein
MAGIFKGMVRALQKSFGATSDQDVTARVDPIFDPVIAAEVAPVGVPIQIDLFDDHASNPNHDIAIVAPPVEEVKPATAIVQSLSLKPTLRTPWKPALAIDALYFDWLMGYAGTGNTSEVEQKVLQALYGLLASDLQDAVIVPRVPSVVPQLLNSLRTGRASSAELSRLIVKDVVLVNEVISAVNSAIYNPATRVSSVENAIMILGEDGLRLVISKVAFRPIINLNAGQYTRRAAPHIWTQSEKTAIAAHYLAPQFGLDPFATFLTALMKNVGLIIAFRLFDQVCEQSKFIYSSTFHHAVASVAATISYRVAQRWDFPEQSVLALQQQTGGSKAIAWTAMGELLHTADLVSKTRLLVNQSRLRSAEPRLLDGLSEPELACFHALNEIPLFDPDAVRHRAENAMAKAES